MLFIVSCLLIVGYFVDLGVCCLGLICWCCFRCLMVDLIVVFAFAG